MVAYEGFINNCSLAVCYSEHPTDALGPGWVQALNFGQNLLFFGPLCYSGRFWEALSRIFRTFDLAEAPQKHGQLKRSDGTSHLLALQQLDIQVSPGRPRCTHDVLQPSAKQGCGRHGSIALDVTSHLVSTAVIHLWQLILKRLEPGMCSWRRTHCKLSA
jgi:hypothetical protein